MAAFLTRERSPPADQATYFTWFVYSSRIRNKTRLTRLPIVSSDCAAATSSRPTALFCKQPTVQHEMHFVEGSSLGMAYLTTLIM